MNKKGRVKKRKFFHASFCFWMQQLLYFIKKCITPPYPIRKVIMESYAAVTAFFCLL